MAPCDRHPSPERRASLGDQVATRISASRRSLAPAAPDHSKRPADPTDPLASALADALLAEVGGQGGVLTLLGPLHGRFRARDDGTVADLLNEYAAMRVAARERHGDFVVALTTGPPGAAPLDAGVGQGAGDAPALPTDLHAVIDRAAGAAATAFQASACARRAVQRGLDHELRGCLNAIRLAAVVHRQTGRPVATRPTSSNARRRAFRSVWIDCATWPRKPLTARSV